MRKWRGESNTARPDELSIQVLQNNQSFVTEVRVLGQDKIYEIVNATVMQRGEGNRIKIVFAYMPEAWLLEFENLFKVFQFMQLHQLFRTRAAAKITDISDQPSVSSQHLVPPQIV